MKTLPRSGLVQQKFPAYGVNAAAEIRRWKNTKEEEKDMTRHGETRGMITRKTVRGIFTLLTMLLFTGCASQHRQLVNFPDQQKTLDNPEKGRIYVIRKPWSINLASHMALVQIRDGDQEIGSIAGHRGYLCWERDPGLATITAGSGGFQGAKIEQQIEKGKVYYILQGLVPVSTCLGIPMGQAMETTLKAVDEETGKKELENCIPPSTEKKN